MANPLIAQGVLNRLKASVIIQSIPSLNVTPPFLGTEGISLALQGEANTSLPTMTGVVQSPEPYQIAVCTIHLLKPQTLAALWQDQQLQDVLIGDVIVRPDVSAGIGLTPYPLYNCSIQGPRDLDFSGRDAGYRVSFSGIYYLNNALYD